MDGWRIRRDLAGDIPFYIGIIAAVGAAAGAALVALIDWTIHRHRQRRR